MSSHSCVRLCVFTCAFLRARLLHHCHHSSLSVMVLLKERLFGIWLSDPHMVKVYSKLLYVSAGYTGNVCVYGGWWLWGICSKAVSGQSVTHVWWSICSQLLTVRPNEHMFAQGSMIEILFSFFFKTKLSTKLVLIHHFSEALLVFVYTLSFGQCSLSGPVFRLKHLKQKRGESDFHSTGTEEHLIASVCIAL